MSPAIFYFAAGDLRRRMMSARLRSCFSIRKDFCYVRFQYDDITSPRIASRVFSADTF